MSILNETTSGGRPTDLGASDKGKMYFETDTNNIAVWDGTNWRGYQSDGQTFGGTSYVAELNGTDQYLKLGDVSGTLGGVNKCSVSWWMKQPTMSSPSSQRIWQTGDGLTNGLFTFWGGSYWIIVVPGGDPRGWVNVKTSGSSTIDDNLWHHWTVVYDGTQSSNTTKVVLYKDAALQTMATDTSGTISTSLPSVAGDEPHIGAYYGTTVSQFSDASFDDFAIFDDALTLTQITNIYNNQIYPSSLKHLYRLENNVNDSVGNADGTVVNGSDENAALTNSPSSPQFPY